MKKKVIIPTLVAGMVLGGSLVGYASPKLSLYLDDKKQTVAVKDVKGTKYIALKDVPKLYGGKYTYDAKTGKNILKTKNYVKGDRVYTPNKTFKGDHASITVNKVSALKEYKGRSSNRGLQAIVLDITIKNTTNKYIKVTPYDYNREYLFNTNEKAYLSLTDSTYDEHQIAPSKTSKAQIVLYPNGELNELKSVSSYIVVQGGMAKGDKRWKQKSETKLDVKFR